MKCPRCNSENPDNQKFCGNCGFEFQTQQPPQKQSPPPSYQYSGSANNIPQKTPFYEKTWFIVLMCIFIPPVGIAFSWIAKKPKNTVARIILTVFLALYSFVWLVGIAADTEEEGSGKREEIKKGKIKKEKPENKIEDGMERISSGEYLFITNEDLNKYCANMEGVKIYVVVEIDDIKEGKIQSTLSDGYMMSNFLVEENYDKYESELKDGDIVGISGTVTGSDGYKFMGKSVNVKNCLIFAVGERAEEYKKDSSDEGLSEYFVVTEEVADSGEELSEEEYKSLCQKLGYEDILRNPDNNKDKYCVVEGTVDQIIEGWLDSFTIFVTDYDGNKWGCVYSYKEGESRLLEGDYVTVYGKCKGTENAETLIGQQVTLPRVDVEYIN